MTDSIRQAVTRALDAAGFAHQSRGPLVRVQIPPLHRRRFQGRDAIQLSFNPEIWIPDPGVELVVPGCAFLEALEAVLRADGAGTSVWIGGELAGGLKKEEEWKKRFTVSNATLGDVGGRFGRRTLLRFVYEVRLPGPPPRTEILPIIWDATKKRVLKPRAASELLARPWYGEAEVRGLVRDPIAPLSLKAHRQARTYCDQELARRLSPLLAKSNARLRARIAEEVANLASDLGARLERADSQHEKDEIREEHERRVALVNSKLGEAYRARLSAETLLVELEHTPEFHYIHGRTQEAVAVTPAMRAGRFLDAQCLQCNEPQSRYLLAPREAGSAPLVCESCGQTCVGKGCDSVLIRSAPTFCNLCRTDRWCTDHLKSCAHCNETICPTHRGRTSCCRRTMCHAHSGTTEDGSERLCPDHGRVCSVDGYWHRTLQGVTCPVTDRWLAKKNAVLVPGDDRPLHPDAVVTCPTSGRRVARDRAVACAHDGRLHHRDEMRRCARSGRLLCPQHRIVTTFPPTETIDSRDARTCQATGGRLHKDDQATCSASAKKVHKSLLITCPVTKKKLLSTAAVSLAGDGRKLHPTAVKVCAATKRPVALDRAVKSTLRPGNWLRRDEAAKCQITGAVGPKRELIVLRCCKRRALLATDVPEQHSHFLPIPDSDGWVCTDHFGRCTSGGHLAKRRTLRTSATSGAPVCPAHRAECVCHGTVHEQDLMWSTPYRDATFCTKQLRMTCERCHLETPRREGGRCEWCDAAAPIGPADLEIRATYQTAVKPYLPWYSVSPTVLVSGTRRCRVFLVDGFFQGYRWFRVQETRTWELNALTAEWEEL